jgi:RNA polymerase sigma-B factor
MRDLSTPSRIDPDEQHELVLEYRRTGDRRLRNRIVESNMHLVDHHVRRYDGRAPVARDDLRQTALLALVKAVDRFDPCGGASVATFAARTIDGEMKRYLRDRTWLVRPPRAAQERHLSLRRATEELTQQLGRAPTVEELAGELELDEDEVLLGLMAGNARQNESLDRPTAEDSSLTRLDLMSDGEDEGYELSESLMTLRDGMERLDLRQRTILDMRFVQELSQTEISERIGVSQSYVSRIIHQALGELRTEFSS